MFFKLSHKAERLLKPLNNDMDELMIRIISIEEKEYNHNSANQDYVPKEDKLGNCLL